MSNRTHTKDLDTNTMTPNYRACNFTSLPREIRDQVYKYHFLNLDNDWGRHEWKNWFHDLEVGRENYLGRKMALALLRTDASTAHIATEMRIFMYTRYPFTVLVPSDGIRGHLTDPTWGDARLQITAINVDVRISGGSGLTSSLPSPERREDIHQQVPHWRQYRTSDYSFPYYGHRSLQAAACKTRRRTHSLT